MSPCFQFFGDIYPEVELLDHMVILCLTFLRNCQTVLYSRRTILHSQHNFKKMNVRSCPQLCLVPLPQGPKAPLRPGSETPPHHQAQLVGAASEVSAAQQDAALINSSVGRKWCPQSCSQGLCTGGPRRGKLRDHGKGAGGGGPRTRQHQSSRQWSHFSQ